MTSSGRSQLPVTLVPLGSAKEPSPSFLSQWGFGTPLPLLPPLPPFVAGRTLSAGRLRPWDAQGVSWVQAAGRQQHRCPPRSSPATCPCSVPPLMPPLTPPSFAKAQTHFVFSSWKRKGKGHSSNVLNWPLAYVAGAAESLLPGKYVPRYFIKQFLSEVSSLHK